MRIRAVSARAPLAGKQAQETREWNNQAPRNKIILNRVDMANYKPKLWLKISKINSNFNSIKLMVQI